MRIDVPEYGTFVDFPDGMDPAQISAAMAQNFPPKAAERGPSGATRTWDEPPGIISRVGSKVGEAYQAATNPEYSMSRKALRSAGALGEAAGDVMMTGVKGAATLMTSPMTRETLGGAAAELADTDFVKSQKATLGDMGRMWGAVPEETRKDVEAALQIPNLIPAVGAAKLVAPVAKEAALIGVDAARLAGRGAKEIVKKALPSAEGLLESGAKWSTTLSPEARKRVSQTILKEKIVLNEKGYEKLEATVNDINSKIKAALKPYNDKPISAADVVKRTSEAKKKANGAYDRKAQLAKVDEEVASFLDNWGESLTVADAQTIKQDIYTQLKSHYDSVAKGGPGKYTDGEIAAKKNIAKGLKEEIEKAAPDAPIKELNARESDLLNLEPHLRRAVGRVGNHNILSLDDVLAAGVGAAMGSSSVGMIAGAAKKIMSPAMKSRMAIRLNAIQGAQQPATLYSRTGKALTAEQPTLEAYLGMGDARVPVTPFTGGPQPAAAELGVGPVRSGATLGEPYGPPPASLRQQKQLPAGQGFEMQPSDIIDVPFTSREIPVPRLEAPQPGVPLGITLRRDAGEGFTMQDAATLPNILRKDGKPFMNEAGVLYAIKKEGVVGYEPVKVEGGWAGVPTQPRGREFRTPNAPPATLAAPDPIKAELANIDKWLAKNEAMRGTPMYQTNMARRDALSGGTPQPTATLQATPPPTPLAPEVGATLVKAETPAKATLVKADKSENALTFLDRQGGVNWGPSYNYSEMRQDAGGARLSRKTGLTPDEAASRLNDSGIMHPDGQPWDADRLAEATKTGQLTKSYTPDKLDAITQRKMRGPEHDWIENHPDYIAAKEADQGAVPKVADDLKRGLLDEVKTEGYDLHVQETELMREYDDFMDQVYGKKVTGVKQPLTTKPTIGPATLERR